MVCIPLTRILSITMGNKRTNGFTIVELLVVVVVIAILASITIVTYNGINTRAYNTQILSGVQQYYKALEVYRTFHGHYPPTTEEQAGNTAVTLTCLGTGYPDQECGTVTGKTIVEDPLFNTEMKEVISAAPHIGLNAVPVQDESFIGAVYGGDTTLCSKSPTCYGRTIQWGLKGTNQDCKISGSYAYNVSSTMTACEIVLEPMDNPED